jgi:multidrug efflux system membrane fusion protein
MALPPRRWFLYGLVALGFAFGVWYFGIREQPPPASSRYGFGGGFRRSSNTAVPVRAIPATKKDLGVHLRAIGTVVPLNTVTVRSRVEGQLMRIAFEEGQHVEKGQLLAEIDPQPYRIQLAEAEAQLRQQQAQLRTARSDLERLKPLQSQNLVTQQEVETQQALLMQREATVAASQAQVEDARRQLDYTKIVAPIAGRVGLRSVDAGNLVRPGDQGGIVTITQTRPISIMFTVAEMDLQKVLEPIRAGQALPVEAWDRGEKTVLATGQLRTIDNQIDLATGTLRLKAEFPNADDKLFPNQFVNVRLHVQTLKDAVVVPNAAVQFGSRGTYVYLVSDQSIATVRDIVLGPSDGDQQSIAKGLQAGDRVILEGLDRLREGRPVVLTTDEVSKPTGTPPADAGKKGGGPGEGKKGSKRSKT